MVRWDDEPDALWLFTPQEILALPDGTKLEDIMGGFSVKGMHELDLDTRGGYTPHGMRRSFDPDLWTEMRLRA